MEKNEEAEIRQLEEELKALGSLDTTSKDYGSPEPEKKDNMFKFFRDILHIKETWKVGNLKDDEIGKTKLSVRSYLGLSRYAQAENLDIVSQYFLDKANIVSAPTMGRKGFLAQLFVTQIKKEQKLSEPTVKKKRWFNFGRDENAESTE